MLNLNERLKTARGYARRYQKDVAKRLKKSVTSICNYEKGINAPSIDELEAIAEFCKVSAVWLVLGKGEMLQRDYVNTDSETLSSLEQAKQERAVLQETLLEDAAQEMRPTKTLTALQRLEQQVQTYGRKNHLGHKQLRDIVLVGGVLLELAWDITSNDEPDAVTESRAEEILSELLEHSNPKTSTLTQALAQPQEAVQ